MSASSSAVRIVRNLDQRALASALVDLLQHDELPNARIPARAAAVRRTLQAPRRGRTGRRGPRRQRPRPRRLHRPREATTSTGRVE